MSEPTFRQHRILEFVEASGAVGATGKEDNIDQYWELVRAGYLNNLVPLTGPYEWTFKLTPKAEDYLAENHT